MDVTEQWLASWIVPIIINNMTLNTKLFKSIHLLYKNISNSKIKNL